MPFVLLQELTLPGTTSPEGFDVICNDGTCVSMIDTPGFNDLRRPDTEVLQSIVDYINARKQKVIAVIYLHRITDKKITGSTKINLRMLRAVCGEHYYQNVKLVTSMWGTVPQASIEATVHREVELNTSPDFWFDMIEKGASYARWDEKLGEHFNTAKQIVELCRSKKDAPILNILLELQKATTIEQTTAGRILTEELRKRQEKERKAIEEEEEELKMLEQERKDLQGRLRNAQDGLSREAELARQGAYERRNYRDDEYDGPPPPRTSALRRRFSEGGPEVDSYREDGYERRYDEQRRRLRRTMRDDRENEYRGDNDRRPTHRNSGPRVERRDGRSAFVLPIPSWRW
jgi:hypothetical protein